MASRITFSKKIDPLDAATASQTTDGGLCDALDVVPQHLSMPLGSFLAQPLASLTASSHYCGNEIRV
ncbi:hypothetical protein ACFX13_035340 [Malus domestica]